jgi:hypothetical protein
MVQNTVVYQSIKNAELTIINGTAVKLFEAIEAANPGWRETMGKRLYALNSFRLYVASGTLGIRFDGVLATVAGSIKVDQEINFIENCDLSKVSLIGAGIDAEIFIQVGSIG